MNARAGVVEVAARARLFELGGRGQVRRERAARAREAGLAAEDPVAAVRARPVALLRRVHTERHARTHVQVGLSAPVLARKHGDVLGRRRARLALVPALTELLEALVNRGLRGGTERFERGGRALCTHLLAAVHKLERRDARAGTQCLCT